MKRYLLTWYGITDMRAALGFEELGGPVLGALKTGDYTDALVLAYTDPTKTGPDTDSAQNDWAQRLTETRAAGSMPVRQEQLDAVDAFANTSGGHLRYKKWLRGEVSRLGLLVTVQMAVKELPSLNDARGIYEAAAEALAIVLSADGEKEVTFYLSPGTPVMAFTWAFVSLVNPEMNIRIIASSDFRKPPETIQLPYELLAPSSRKRRHAVPGGRELDVIFHLFGEQRLPSLLGILQFPCRSHVFVTSAKYPPDVMRQFVPEDADFGHILVNAFDPMSAKVEILKAVAQMPAGTRIGFNLTGGTKLMFAGAIAACRKVGGIPFYFETREHTLVFLDDYATMDIRGVADVEQFIGLNGFAVSRRGKWEDNSSRGKRAGLTMRLWKDRRQIAKLYKRLSQYADRDGPGHVEFSLQEGDVSASLDPNARAFIRIGSTEFAFQDCPDFASYLCGGWLEEYVYLKLEHLQRTGTLRDLRIGLTVSWKQERQGEGRTELSAQEFDVACTDGKRLIVLECKAGWVRSEDIYKLQDCVRNYGGSEARGILVAAFPPGEAARRRLGDAQNLSFMAGRDVPAWLDVAVSTLANSPPPESGQSHSQ